MSALGAVWRELLGLFVDDGNLAVQATCLLALLGLTVPTGVIPPLVGAWLLVGGLLLILALSVLGHVLSLRPKRRQGQ
ncbi:hypothetical protein [Radicibacter daui]|uniref:hypothetical protein n=1 Tax=Radicibacter daui TaxID=3064829 RepID=UPI00404698EB